MLLRDIKIMVSSFPQYEPISRQDYTGGRTAPELIDFLNRKAGTHRKVGGMLSQHAGRAAACDALVAGFLHAEGPERRRVLQEVGRPAKAPCSIVLF